MPDSSTKKHVAGSPSVKTIDPASRRSTRPWSANSASWSSASDSNRNSVRSSAGSEPIVHRASRYRCTNETAIAPSPTAEATRFTDLRPYVAGGEDAGTLDSRWYGSRGSDQPAGRRPSATRSVPVSTNPSGSRVTTPSSHSVRGWAPMKTNRPLRVDGALLPGVEVTQGDLLQVVGAGAGDHLGTGVHLDGVDAGDLVDQVLRHRGQQVPTADQHVHPAGVPGEVDRRLPGRVAPPMM